MMIIAGVDALTHREGLSPLQLAILNGHPTLCQLLLGHRSINLQHIAIGGASRLSVKVWRDYRS
jgi:hypothetical protein